MVTHPPLGRPPIMEAKHDGEGAGGQQLLFVLVLVLVLVVVQAVGCCQSKSVANLRGKSKYIEFSSGFTK